MTDQHTGQGPYYDVVIIGGGIQGCGCAQAIAAAGYSVLLIEKNSLGSGTSSRSSKLIHGGLRYLETGQFSLVRKSLNERGLLTRLAPELVELKPFYIPIYKNSRLGRWKLTAGLSLYSLLGNLRSDSRFSLLPKSQWHQLQGLKHDQLKCVFKYYDAQTDDLLLTQAVAQSAESLGAVVQQQCEFTGATKNEDGTVLVSLRSRLEQTHGEHPSHVHCQVLINAAGPWVVEVEKLISFAQGKTDITLVQGSHIELDQPLASGIFYVESPVDGRPVFIMPWPSGTLVGTTEKAHLEHPDKCAPTQQEIDYLQTTLQHYFPDYRGNLLRSWAGLRVLPSPKSKTGTNALRPFSSLARDTIIQADKPTRASLITLYGGKLTAYRTTAADVAQIAADALREKGTFPQRSPVDTATLNLRPPS